MSTSDMLSASARGSLAAAMSNPKSLLSVPMTTVIQCPDCGGRADLVHVIVDLTLLPAIPLRCIDLPSYCAEMHHAFSPEQVSRMEARINLFMARVGEYMLRTCGDDTDLATIAREDQADRDRQRREYWAAMAVQQKKLDARQEQTVEEIQWGVDVTDAAAGTLIASYDALLVLLTERRKHELGRSLGLTESDRCRRVARYLWNLRNASQSEIGEHVA